MKMPFSYTIDTNLDVVFFVAQGAITDEELMSTGQALFNDPRFQPDYRLLFDLSDVTENSLSSVSLERLSKVSKFSTDARRAVLVKRNAEFGMARMHQAYCAIHDRTPPEIFHTRVEALEYLNTGLSPEKQLQ